MNGSFGFRKRSLFPWRLRFSYHVEEFDNTARYNNHQDEASSGKWLSIHDSSVPAAKLKQASKVDPSKEIKNFWMVKNSTSYLFSNSRSSTYTFTLHVAFIGKGLINCESKLIEDKGANKNDQPCGP